MISVNEPLLDGKEAKCFAECIETGWISSEGPFVRKLEEGRQHLKLPSPRWALALAMK